jgi:GDPmannose 4,6-dehydratase
MMKKALITGVTGQDGSYLARFLLGKGYEVHGLKRAISLRNTDRIDGIYKDPLLQNTDFLLHYGDMTDGMSLHKVISEVRPDEIYNLAAQSHVAVSFQEPEFTTNADALGCLRVLEAIKNCGLVSQTKFYQASTSELYGDTLIVPQNEQTPFNPCSPYAIAKHYAFQMTKLYREAYGMYACNGILFNHESPVRGETFVTRKITIALSKIFKGIQECLFLGNLDSKRDWGHAEDYVRAQWLILQAQEPDDYVVSTGEQISVRDFVELCLKELGISIKWQGNGIDECGIVTDVAQSEYGNTDLTKGSVIVRVSKDYFRPAEVSNLLGDSTKIRTNLNWRPSISVDQLAKEMIISDLQKI